jgi:hypothetical protein
VWREEAFAVAFAEQEREAGEVVAERFGSVGVAADEAVKESLTGLLPGTSRWS